MIHFFDPSSEKMLARLPDMAARRDILLGNLEDAIPADRKEAARAGLVRAGREIDLGDTPLWTRVNALESPWVLDDLVTLVTEIGDRLDVVMVPKVEGPWDIHYVDRLLAQLEARAGLERPILVHAILETAQGVANVEEIANASPRMQGMSFGPADLAASRRMKTTRVGGGHPGYRVVADPDGDARPRPSLPAGPLALHDRPHGRRLRRRRHLPVLRAVRRHQGPRGLRGPVPRRLPDGLRRHLVAAPRPDRRSPRRSSPPSRPRSRSRAGSSRRSRTARGVHMIDGKMQDDATWKQSKVMVDLAEMLARKDPELAEAYGMSPARA